jgi:hypothetical protein
MRIRALLGIALLCFLLPVSALATSLQIGAVVLTQVVPPSPNGSPGVDELDVLNLSGGLADVTDTLVFGNASLTINDGTTALLDEGPGAILMATSTTCSVCDISTGYLQFSSSEPLTMLHFTTLLNTSTVNGGTQINPNVSLDLSFSGGRMPYDEAFAIYANTVSTGVPEPGTAALILSALTGSIFFRRRRLANV